MFTTKQVLASSFIDSAEIEVLKEFSFSYVGKVGSKIFPRLVPCETALHVQSALSAKGISGIIIKREFVDLVPVELGLAISESPVASAWKIHDVLCMTEGFHWTSFESRVSSTAKVSRSAVIADRDVVIGDESIVYPNAVILPRTIIGRYCTVGPNSVIGGEGFEVDQTTFPRKVLRQAGGVRISDYVDIQSNCTIVRAIFGGYTEIGQESKFDCQVHLAHDCVVGSRVRIAACAEISGRVSIGDDVFVGPNVSIANGLNIGAGSHISIGSVVTLNVPENSKVSGNFAIQHERWLSFVRSIR